MHHIRTLAEVQRSHILNTLHLCGNNRTHAAKALGMSIRGLRIKLQQYEKQGFTVRQPNASNQTVEKQDSADYEAA